MSIQDSWSCLSVQKFFSLCNWQGQPLENRNHHTDPSSDLTLEVNKFFQFIPWEGNPEIGSLSKVTSTSQTNPSIAVETKIADLFEF